MEGKVGGGGGGGWEKSCFGIVWGLYDVYDWWYFEKWTKLTRVSTHFIRDCTYWSYWNLLAASPPCAAWHIQSSQCSHFYRPLNYNMLPSLPTTYQLTTYQPHVLATITNHILSTIPSLLTTYRPRANHILPTYQPHTDHILYMYQVHCIPST